MAVGYQCASTLKDIEGTIINQGDLVVCQSADSIGKGIVTQVTDASLTVNVGKTGIALGRQRVIQRINSQYFILVLKKFNEK